MVSKTDKFWKKYWLSEDKESKYMINGLPYVGKDELRSANDRVSDRVVMQLMRPYLCKGRNITTESYFTFLKLANQLKEKQKSLLGKVKKIRSFLGTKNFLITICRYSLKIVIIDFNNLLR